MTRADTIAVFLDDAARYFERRPTGGEDRAHWANVYNAQNCREAAQLLRDRDASLAEDAKRLSPEGVAARAEGIAQPQVHPHKDS